MVMKETAAAGRAGSPDGLAEKCPEPESAALERRLRFEKFSHEDG